jgi:hypothetical protein
MEFTETAAGFRVVDAVGTTLMVETDGWRSPAPSAPSVETTLAGRVDGPEEPVAIRTAETSALRLPWVKVVVVDLQTETYHPVTAGEALSLPAGRYLIRATTPVRLFARVDGPVTVETDDGMVVDFADATPVSVGFEPSADTPDTTVTVPRTVAGVARAVSTFGAGAEPTGPDRSWPSVRDRPPLVRFGDETEVPTAVTDDRPETGVRLRLPRTLQTVLVSASLAYYLGATVTVASGATPGLDLDGTTISLGPDGPVPVHDDVTTPTGPVAFASRASRLLEYTFFGDCLVRGVGPHGDPVAAADRLPEAGLDPQQLYDAPLATRVERYLAAPLGPILADLPAWHLSISAVPDYETVDVLSRTAHTLPALSPPRGRRLPAETVVRGGGTRADGGHWRGGVSTPAVEPDSPSGVGKRVAAGPDDLLDSARLPDGRVRAAHDCGVIHGWCAPGQPVTAFDAVPAGFRNRDRFVDDEDGPLSVLAVAGADDHDELPRIVDQYERRRERLALSVETLTEPTVADLARAFERGVDLLHFVGHREPGGLVCADGLFSPTTLAESNARTFFLNACDSYADGVALVERGSVAGVVTCRDVLDEMATSVGVTFARLLAHGFSVAGATRVARHRTLVDADYLAVGDGTHVVSQTDDIAPSRYEIETTDEGTVAVVARNFSPDLPGAQYYHERIDSDDAPRLSGVRKCHQMDTTAFDSFLANNSGPFFYDGDIYWSEELREALLA